MPVHNHMPAAQELDGDALGMLVSCLCGTGSDQKVAARRVRPAMQQAAGRHNDILLGFTGQACQQYVRWKALVCLQECVRGLGRLATELCPVRSLVLQPLILLKITAYLRSRCKVALLCLHMASSGMPLKTSFACPATTGVHSVAEHMHCLHPTQHSSQHAGVRYANM